LSRPENYLTLRIKRGGVEHTTWQIDHEGRRIWGITANLTPMLHGSVYQMTRIYEQYGQKFCHYLRYHANDLAGKVLICPPSANRSRMLEKIPRN